MKEIIIINKLDAAAKMPEETVPKSTVLNLYAKEDTIIPPGQQLNVGTGVSFSLSSDYCAKIYVVDDAKKKFISLEKEVLTIKSGNINEIIVPIRNTSTIWNKRIKRGELVAQALIAQADFQVELHEADTIADDEELTFGENEALNFKTTSLADIA